MYLKTYFVRDHSHTRFSGHFERTFLGLEIAENFKFIPIQGKGSAYVNCEMVRVNEP
jgi:hypothetical protein